MLSDQILKWFYDKVWPDIVNVARMEKQTRDLEQCPMTQLLFNFLQNFKDFDIKKDFQYEDWVKFMINLLSYSSKYPLDAISYDQLPKTLSRTGDK